MKPRDHQDEKQTFLIPSTLLFLLWFSEKGVGRQHFNMTNISPFFILHSQSYLNAIHLISLSISVKPWLIGGSCLKHHIRSHIGLQRLLQMGHIFNVQTTLKGQWNGDWLLIMQGQRAWARTVLSKVEPAVSLTKSGRGRTRGTDAIFAIPLCPGFTIKIRICFHFDRGKKEKRKDWFCEARF